MIGPRLAECQKVHDFHDFPQVYFMPDTDITDIGQFRRCYTLVGQGPMGKKGGKNQSIIGEVTKGFR